METTGRMAREEELTAQLATTQQDADRAVEMAEARVAAEYAQQQATLERQVQACGA